MRRFASRVIGIILRPEAEWQAIAEEREGVASFAASYVAPLALIGPIAFVCGALAAPFGLTPTAAASAVWAGLFTQVLGLAVTAAVIWLIAPLYGVRRDFLAGFRVVAYAATPVWLAGIVLAVPLQRFPLLVVIILIALMHGLYLFHLGLHHVTGIPRRDAAECAGAVAFSSLVLSTLVGYYGSAIGLIPSFT